jgi:Zn-dependent peptidase ImmA (M78 family)
VNYTYRQKQQPELESIAERLWANNPGANNGFADVEELVESLGFIIFPRPGLAKATQLDGYVPKVKGMVLIDADLHSRSPEKYRVTLAEELAHLQLEPELWAQGVPPGARIYEVDRHIYDLIEADAYNLAMAILMPAVTTRQRFTAARHQVLADGGQINADWMTVEMLANEVKVPLRDCAHRCRKLGLCDIDIRAKPLDGAVIL